MMGSLGFHFLVILWMGVTSLSSTPTRPIMKCPVGVDLDTAYFFKYIRSSSDDDDVIYPNIETRINDFEAKSDEERKTEMIAEISNDLGIVDDTLADLDDSSLIDYLSMYYANKYLSTDKTAKSSLLLNRDDMEDKVEDDGEDSLYFHWYQGLLSPQKIVMMACGADYHLASDLPFDDPRDICYEYSANHVQQGSYLVTVVTGKNVGVSGLYKFYEQSDGDERATYKHESKEYFLFYSADHETSARWMILAVAGFDDKDTIPTKKGIVHGISNAEKPEDVEEWKTQDDDANVVQVLKMAYVETMTVPAELEDSDNECKLTCRKNQKLMWLQDPSDDSQCYCSSQPLVSRMTCPEDSSSHYKMESTGLGHPMVPFSKFPASLPDDLTLGSLIDSSMVQVDDMTLKIVLFDDKIFTFKVEKDVDGTKNWEDGDENPTVTYLDHRLWTTNPSSTEYLYENIGKTIVEQTDPEEAWSKDVTKFKEARLYAATSMTILPVYVTMDEQIFPDDGLNMDDDDYPVYDSETWTDNLAGRPYPGGKWFNHIIIAHRAKKQKTSTSMPTMTVLRIMEDGTLYHMINKPGGIGNGQFLVPNFKKNVDSMTPLTIGRQSYFLTASNSPNHPVLNHEDYSIVEAFKVTDKLSSTTITQFGRIGYLDTESLGGKIEVFNVKKVVFLDFYIHLILAVLDTTDDTGTNSRLRLFLFNPDGDEVFTQLNNINFDSEVFTNLYAFKHDRERYLVLSKAAVDDSTKNKAEIFKVKATGILEELEGYEDDLADGALVDLIPLATGTAKEETQLLEVRQKDGGTTCSMLIFEEDTWSRDGRRSSSLTGTVSSSSFSVGSLPRMMRSLGVNVYNDDTDGLQFHLFVIPTVPRMKVDKRVQLENHMYLDVYPVMFYDFAALTEKKNAIDAELAKYVAKSGSKVTGNWALGNVKTGTMNVQSQTQPPIPTETVLKMKIKENEEDQTVIETEDIRDIVDIQMTKVEEKLNDAKDRITVLQNDADDLLLTNSPNPQTITGKIVIDGTLLVEDKFKFEKASESSNLVISKISTPDDDPLNLEDFSSIYSKTQNNVKIQGDTAFKKKVSFSKDIQVVNLDSDQTLSPLAAASLLKYDGDRTFSVPQTFNGDVTVSGNLGLGVDVKLAKGNFELDMDNIPVNGNVDGVDATIHTAIVESDDGLTAPNLAAEFAVGNDNLVPKDQATFSVKGTLQLVKLAGLPFTTEGSKLGVVNAKVNGHNVEELYQNAAWLSIPESLEDDLGEDPVIEFQNNVKFADVTFTTDVAVDEINDVAFAKYVKKASRPTLEVGGTKTFTNLITANSLASLTFNSKSLSQFITKKSPQTISGTSTFMNQTTVKSIDGVNGQYPLIDGKNLITHISYDIPSIIDGANFITDNTIPRETIFSTIRIADGATIAVKNKINDVDWNDRSSNIVRTDDESVDISGVKVIENEVIVDKIMVDKIETDFDSDSSSYGNEYNMEDFVNTKNDQIIPSGKTFTGSVTFGDIFFVDHKSSVNDVNIAPLLNCWIDTNSQNDVVIKKKVVFSNLITDGLETSKDITCDVEETYESAVGFIGYEAQEIDSKLMLMNEVFNYLDDKYPDHYVNFGVYGDDNIGNTFVTEILARSQPAEIGKFDDTIHKVRKLLKIWYEVDTSSMTEMDLARLYCRKPRLNDIDPTDFALLDDDNEFCPDSSCTQTFNNGLSAEELQVDGNLIVGEGNSIFGVDVDVMEDERVSLSVAQTLNGIYTFNDLTVGADGLSGEVLYNYEDRDQSLYDLDGKLLKKISEDEQTFTKLRNLKKLTSSLSVDTKDGSVLTIGDDNLDIKNIYDSSFKLDEANTITNLEMDDVLKVSTNVVVDGEVDSVNVRNLFQDIVINGPDILIEHEEDSEDFSITGTDNTINIAGKKIFTLSPTVTSIAVTPEGDSFKPSVDTSSKSNLVLTKGDPGLTRILVKNGDVQTITGDVLVKGDVKVEGDLKTDDIDDITFDSVYGKYEYDSTSSTHVIKTQFNFGGNLDINLVKAPKARSRNWDEFVEDAVSVVCGDVMINVVWPQDEPDATKTCGDDEISIQTVSGQYKVFEVTGDRPSFKHTVEDLYLFYNDVHQSGSPRWVLECGEFFLEEKLLQFGLNKEDGGGFIFSTDEEICPNEVESWSTNFNTGDITVSSLPIVGQKEFEGSVTISGTDATLNTFNQIDLSSVHSSQAFINQPATFTGVNTFSHPGEISDIQGANSFRATSEINLVDSTIGDAFDVKWLFGHTILKDATDPVPITGTLKFAENVILESDSSVHHLGEYGKQGSYQVSVLTGDNVEVSGVYKFFEKLFLRSTYKHESKEYYLFYSTQHDTSARWMIVSDVVYNDEDVRVTKTGLVYGISNALKPEDVEEWKSNDDGATVVEVRNLDNPITVPEDLVLLDTTALNIAPYTFKGVSFLKDLKITGTVDGYDLTEFDDAFYKSKSLAITGSKTFSSAVMDNDLSTTGNVNGMNPANNLVFLATTNSLEGLYKFDEATIQNLQVTGLIDGLNWNDIPNHLFYVDVEQTITATYTFDTDTSKITFQGAIIGDGNDDNGRGFLNDQKVESIEDSLLTWETIDAVKVSAQAEANVLCNHVKALDEAYMNNINVDFYSELGQSTSLGFTPSIIDIIPVKLVLDLKSNLELNLLAILDEVGLTLGHPTEDPNLDFTQLSQHSITAASSMTFVPYSKEELSVLLMVSSSGGLVLLRIQINKDDNHVVDSVDMKTPIPDVIGIKYVPELDKVIAFYEVTDNAQFKIQVKSYPSPDYFESLDLYHTAITNDDPEIILIWESESYDEKLSNPNFDVMKVKDQLLVAVNTRHSSSSIEYITILQFIIHWPGDIIFEVTSVLHSPSASNKFVFVSANEFGYLVVAHQSKIETLRINMDSRVIAKMEDLVIDGKPGVMKNFKNSVTVLVDAKKLLVLKYAGLQGMKVDATVYLSHSPVESYTFYTIDNRKILITESEGALNLYSTRPTLDEFQTNEIECRYPEAGDEFVADPYCSISYAHTMCRFSGPDPNCDLLHRGLSTQQKEDLTEKLNEYRSQIADGSMEDKGVPQAANMRRITWSDELAKLAEMWASQCSTSLENIRTVLDNDQQKEYAQNIVRFEFNTEKDVSDYQMEEVVKYWFNSMGDTFDASIIGSFNVDTNDADLGYFTQLAWARTYKIGCGWSQYRSRPGGSISVVVCNYLEHGNKPGEKVYIEGTKCDQCDDDESDNINWICGDDGTLCIPE